MRLIGITGFKTSGKDTTFKVIKEQQEQGVDDTRLSPHLRVERRAFADNMKIMAAQSLGYEGSDTELISLMDDFKELGTLTIDRTTNPSVPPTEATFIEAAAISADSLNPKPVVSISGRQYVQFFGSSARAVFGKEFWIDQVLPFDGFLRTAIWETFGRPTDESLCPGLPAVGCVTDVRYENEAQRILDLDGEMWEVIRPGLQPGGHITEIPLPRELITRQIKNTGSISDLRTEVHKALFE